MIGDDVKHYCRVKYFLRLFSEQYSRNSHELTYGHFCLHGLKSVAIEGQCTGLEDAKRRRDKYKKECFRHRGQKRTLFSVATEDFY